MTVNLNNYVPPQNALLRRIKGKPDTTELIRAAPSIGNICHDSTKLSRLVCCDLFVAEQSSADQKKKTQTQKCRIAFGILIVLNLERDS